ARKAYSTHFLVFVKGVVFDANLTTSKTAGFRKSTNYLTNRSFAFTLHSPLVTLGVPGSGCVLYGFVAELASGFVEKLQIGRHERMKALRHYPYWRLH
ncbi:hypothetical protein, partial [Vreelandella neptunia]